MAAALSVDVDPTTVGYVRRERPGAALALAVVGTLVALVSLTRSWVETQLFVSTSGDATTTLDDRQEFVGLSAAVDTVREVTGPARDAHDPGALAELFFPRLAIVLTVVCCLVAIVAAFGLRRPALTATVRLATIVVVGASIVLATGAFLDLGWQANASGSSSASTSSATVAPTTGPAPEVIRATSEVQPFYGFLVWFIGLGLLLLAGALGPWVVYRLADGAAAPGAGPPPELRSSTHVISPVIAGLGTLLVFAGYTFLSWATGGETVTFSEIGDAVRDQGLSSSPVAEAYFAGLGWIVLLWLVGATALLALAARPAGLGARALRPAVLVVTALALLVHLVAMIEVNDAGGDFGVGAGAVTIGLGLTLLATMVPLRTTARVLLAPR